MNTERFGQMRMLSAAHAGAGYRHPLQGDFTTRVLEAGLNPQSFDDQRTIGFEVLERYLSAVEAGMTFPSFRAASPLPPRAEVLVDQAVLNVGRQRLTFVADLLSEGLVYNLPDPMGTPFLEWNSQNRIGAAERVMVPSHRGERGLAAMTQGRIPVYCTTDFVSFNLRELATARRAGIALDTSSIEQKIRSINEAIEDAAINGATTFDGQTLQVAGYTAPGLLNAPNANTGNLTSAYWDSTPDGAAVVGQVQTMIAALQADNFFGPYNLYIPTAIATYFAADYSATKGENSIIDRLEKIQAGGRTLRVRQADFMPATKVALVQMSNDVVDMVVGQQPTVIPYTSVNGMEFNNLIVAVMVQRFRSDYDSNSGVYIGTIA